MNEQEFLKKLKAAFVVEADEHFSLISQELLALERMKASEAGSSIETVFRETHSLKGAARAIKRRDVEMLCQSMESVFAVWKNNPSSMAHAHFDTFAGAVEQLGLMLECDDEMPSTGTGLETIQQTLQEIADSAREVTRTEGSNARTTIPVNGSRNGTAAKPESNPRKSSPGSVQRDSVRVSIVELDRLYRRAEELSTLKFMISNSVNELHNLELRLKDWKREYHKLERQFLYRPRGEEEGHNSTQEKNGSIEQFLTWTAQQIETVDGSLEKLHIDERNVQYFADSLGESILEQAKHLLLMPFSFITDPLPAMARSLARDVNKKLVVDISGSEIRIDKRILEDLKDPLVHLLRNSIDHGIENSEKRRYSEKSDEGNIAIRISEVEGNRVEVLVSDDGGGLDPENILNAALKKDCISSERAGELNEKQILELVFESGLSTSPLITDISGRGIGLSVVRENILGLGGSVTVESTPGRGVAFRIRVPVSLSNSRGVLVRSSKKDFIIPLQYVDRGISLPREEIYSLENRPVFDYNNCTVALRELEDLLGFRTSRGENETDRVNIVVLRKGKQYLGLQVDDILWEQDIVVKPLPKPLDKVAMIGGASVLSSGELLPVLEVSELFEGSSVRQSLMTDPQTEIEEVPRRLLVVDDSITSRVLIHDILSTSGYSVKAAVDGIDALTLLREEEFELVVSDVEMPRMNGFDLTKAIRAEHRMKDIPVVLVTSLESQEDKERGYDAGANAYIVKSSFDQSNLIDVVNRLLA